MALFNRFSWLVLSHFVVLVAVSASRNSVKGLLTPLLLSFLFTETFQKEYRQVFTIILARYFVRVFKFIFL